MAFKKKKNKICLGVATTMLFTTVFIIILSAILSKLGLEAEKNVLPNPACSGIAACCSDRQ